MRRSVAREAERAGPRSPNHSSETCSSTLPPEQQGWSVVVPRTSHVETKTRLRAPVLSACRAHSPMANEGSLPVCHPCSRAARAWCFSRLGVRAVEWATTDSLRIAKHAPKRGPASVTSAKSIKRPAGRPPRCYQFRNKGFIAFPITSRASAIQVALIVACFNLFPRAAILLSLCRIEPRIGASLRQEFVVGSTFGDLPVFYHGDDIGHTHRTKTVRDE